MEFVVAFNYPDGVSCYETMDVLLKDRIAGWKGKRLQKEAAGDLQIPLSTYIKYENGDRTPKKLAMAELLRRMEETRK